MGVLVSDATRHGLRRALHHQRARGRAGDRLAPGRSSTALRAVVANSGGSNVGDGQRGLETALAMQAAAAEELGVEPEQVGVASTGVIGIELPREPAVGGRARGLRRRSATTRPTSPRRS